MNRQSTRNTTIQTKPKNSLFFFILLVILFIMPWPHGGEVVWQYLLFSLSIFTLSAWYLINNSQILNKQFSELKVIKVPLMIIGAWLAFQLVQVIPLPLALQNIDLINSHVLNNNQWQTISIAPSVTLVEIIKHTSYIAIFILALLLLNTMERILFLAQTLFIGSAIIAFYSLVNHYTKGAVDLVSSIPPWTVSWERAAHGTFSYQNHYASFLTMTIPLSFGLIYANNQQSSDNTLIGKLINLLTSINGIYLLSAVIMIIALFKTASRGGNSIFLVSIVITFFSVVLQQNKSIKAKVKTSIKPIISMLVMALVIILSGLTDTLTKRLESQGFEPSGRDLMHQTAYAIIQDRPVLGTGAGTYPVLQHKYKSPSLGLTEMSKRAHNDYLELLANQGITGFSLLAISTLMLLVMLFNGLKEPTTRSKGKQSLHGLQIASFCSAIAILLHSLADFNFHLPVNAVYFYMLIAIGIKIQTLKKPKQLKGV